jgi:hypothetical protein
MDTNDVGLVLASSTSTPPKVRLCISRQAHCSLLDVLEYVAQASECRMQSGAKFFCDNTNVASATIAGMVLGMDSGSAIHPHSRLIDESHEKIETKDR